MKKNEENLMLLLLEIRKDVSAWILEIAKSKNKIL